MPERLIPVAGPSITEKEIAYVTDAVTNGWYGNANAYISRFEHAFAEYCGVAHAAALPSCTSAIHLALVALGVGPGDEVIVPDVTWIASAAPIAYVGATPRFADVDADSWCLDPQSFESLITGRTAAVIPVDLYGGMADMPSIAAIAARHGVAVIEDAAEAVGAKHGSRMAGSFGDAGVFSFHGSKTLTTGEGGMLITDSSAVYERVQILRDHGRRPGDRAFFNREVAFKYKMSGLQAALGLAQLERIEELIAMKRQAFAWYEEALGGVEGVTLNYEAPDTRSVYWMVTARLDPRFGVTKDQMRDAFAAEQIDTRPFFHPLSSLPAYEHVPDAAAARERNVVSYALSPYAINLPSSLSLTREDVARVATTLRRLIGAA
ncbi:MAG TPA: DegT/DnrJ/EryC1/StrS family aminotransferase [Thermoanaerobaculia bacterium]|nr:DegT/DnrJ/EryC1/StrS family aminotransferase [Thermoanaerobaculia bacterium]